MRRVDDPIDFAVWFLQYVRYGAAGPSTSLVCALLHAGSISAQLPKPQIRHPFTPRQCPPYGGPAPSDPAAGTRGRGPTLDAPGHQPYLFPDIPLGTTHSFLPPSACPRPSTLSRFRPPPALSSATPLGRCALSSPPQPAPGRLLASRPVPTKYHFRGPWERLHETCLAGREIPLPRWCRSQPLGSGGW